MGQFSDFVRRMPPVTKNLIIINLIIWAAMALSPVIDSNLNRYCALHYIEATGFNPVQFVSYMFLHGGFAHVFFNMFTLFMFGIALEHVMGSKRFLLFYMVCGVGAGLIQEAVWSLTLPDMVYEMLARQNLSTVEMMRQFMASEPDAMAQNFNIFTTVGASGAIYGVLLAFAMIFPNQPMYFMFFPVPVKAKWMVLIWGALELLLGLSAANDGVAHFAHLGGMIFGLMLILYWKKKGDIHTNLY